MNKMGNLEFMYNKQMHLEGITKDNSGIEIGKKIFLQVVALMIEGGEYMNELEVHKFWKINKKRNLPKAREEAIDCLHFVLAIIGNLGVTMDQIMDSLYTFDEELEQYGDDLEAVMELGKKLYIEPTMEFDDRINHFYSWFMSTMGELIVGIRRKTVSVENLAFSLVLVVTLCVGCDMTSEEILEEYTRKNNINLKRQEDKY